VASCTDGNEVWEVRTNQSAARPIYGHLTSATNILRRCWRHKCFDRATALCDILYKRFRNILTYLLNQQLLEIGEGSAQVTDEEDDVSIVTWLTNWLVVYRVLGSSKPADHSLLPPATKWASEADRLIVWVVVRYIPIVGDSVISDAPAQSSVAMAAAAAAAAAELFYWWTAVTDWSSRPHRPTILSVVSTNAETTPSYFGS